MTQINKPGIEASRGWRLPPSRTEVEHIIKSSKSALSDKKTQTFAQVAHYAIHRRQRQWKDSTISVNKSYLRTQILPYFGDQLIDEIERVDVRRWFVSRHATPAAANRALPILSGIFEAAIAAGWRTDNPCRGVRKYPMRHRRRYLNDMEIRRLGNALRAYERPIPSALIRLLVLTGARQGELRRLRWADYRDGHLHLPDAKAGPRTIWLHAAARQVFDDLPVRSKWVFPSKIECEISNSVLYNAWDQIRHAAGLDDVRLHDLRHTYASFALRHGESIMIVGKLLGHRDVKTTMGYSHFNDSLALQAAQSVADRL